MVALTVLTIFMCLSAEAKSMNVKLPHADCDTCPGTVEMGDADAAMKFLTKYGYMRQESQYKLGILKFQNFFNLPSTGELDSATVKQMNERRFNCGKPDIINKLGIFPRRKKRFILQGSKWRRGNITYRITKYPSPSSTRMSNVEVDRELRKAFGIWTKHANLNFIHRKSPRRVHMEIRFESGAHGDDDDFDGAGGVLAHGFFPVYGGDTHFDDEEEWVRNGENGSNPNKTPIDLLVTAAHEIGHALGLSHSRERRSLMAPYYTGYMKDLKLQSDDIEGIQKLYGPNPNNMNKPNGEPERCAAQDCDLCKNTKVDTLVNHQGSTFVFSGDFYWKLVPKRTELEEGYPRNITEDWDGLPGDIDASFTWKNGKTFFLKGSQLWRFTAQKMDKKFPQEISKALPGIPNNVSAAFYWPPTQSAYFFKGTQFWEFDPRKKPRVGNSFPISDIPGFPSSIDAAVEFFNGRIYVFSERWYYRINKEHVRLDISPTATDPFPRVTTDRWFGCKEKEKDTTTTGPLGKLELVEISGVPCPEDGSKPEICGPGK